jgi:hypothetical protein
MVTLPPWLLSTDFGIYSYRVFVKFIIIIIIIIIIIVFQKVKGKAVPIHAMKAYARNRGVAPLIRKLFTRRDSHRARFTPGIVI